MTTQTIPNPQTSCTEDNAVVNHNSYSTAPNFAILNSSIKETFTAIDRFEWQASYDLVVMRDNHRYLDAGHKSFEDYCEKELTRYGGYRRIRELLAAKKVLDTLPDPLKDKITKPSQTRPLLRLVKTPDKLEEAVAIAAKQKPFPTMADFAKAAQEVAPSTKRRTKPQQPSQTQLCHSVGEKVRVCEKSHPRYGEQGTIESDAPNHWQQIVTFDDDEKLLVNNNDLDAPSASFPRERILSPDYAEALAQKDEQHKREIERLEPEITARVQAQADARAEAKVQEKLQSLHQLFQQQKERNILLQQQVDELEKLRGLEFENRRQKQRIQELENRLKEQTEHERDKGKGERLKEQENPLPPSFIDLRSLAEEAPKQNAQECLRLMGIALGNLASAMNNAQALVAAALILDAEPIPQAIAYRMEQLQFVPQAISDIRQVLSQPGCTWWDYCEVAQQYEVIQQDYLAELTDQEKEFIDGLKNALVQSFRDESATTDTQVIGAIEEVRTELSIEATTEPPTDEQTIYQTELNTGSLDSSNQSPTSNETIDQTDLVSVPQKAQSPTIGLGSIVAHADPYRTLYNAKGEVIEDFGDEVLVAWDHWRDESRKSSRYFLDELRLWVDNNQ